MSDRVRHKLSVAVFVVLRRGDGVCLLRRIGTGWMDGQFSLPAGTLEPHETIRGAAVREAREEVGIELDPAALRHVHLLHGRTAGNDWTGHFFIATHWTGEPRICEPDKHGELCWAPMSELPDLVIPYVRQALDAVAQGQTYSEYGWTD